MYKIKYPLKKNLKEIKLFFKLKKLDEILSSNHDSLKKVNEMIQIKPYGPDIKDLYQLYSYVIKNKRTTILEFGSGWSSLVFALALSELKKKYFKKTESLRRNNLFELFILENEKKYLNITKKRINKLKKKLKLNIKVNYNFSAAYMTSFNNRICTKYQKLPLCNPDFIYLDGPDQFNIKGSVNGVSTRHNDMMPMTSDILSIEHFLTPGTIIISDGRAANVKFLKDNFQRKWAYKHDVKNDQHMFCLKDPLLGKYNKNQVKFYSQV